VDELLLKANEYYAIILLYFI